MCLCQVLRPRAEGGAYNTIWTLPCPEWSKAPIPSYPDGTFLQRCRAWSFGTAFDSNVLSYPVLIIMKEQGIIGGQGGACPRPSCKTEPVLSRRARQDLPSDIGRGKACPQTSGEAEPALGGRARRSHPLAVGPGEARPWTSGEAEPALGHRARRSQPSGVERGEASPWGSGEAEPALGRRARRSLPSDIGRGGAGPQTSSEAEPAPRHWAR